MGGYGEKSPGQVDKYLRNAGNRL
ncbi:MAG: hypothetical protein QOC73_587, partial [Actinomycetota bacterium]|nr:hypothetical protein [Actinomycetota bacterium]